MASTPVPPPPIVREELLLQAEPAFVTVTDPCEPAPKPTKPIALLTRPPSAMVSAPVPALPTKRFPPLVQVEPVPVTVPCEPVS